MTIVRLFTAARAGRGGSAHADTRLRLSVRSLITALAYHCARLSPPALIPSRPFLPLNPGARLSLAAAASIGGGETRRRLRLRGVGWGVRQPLFKPNGDPLSLSAEAAAAAAALAPRGHPEAWALLERRAVDEPAPLARAAAARALARVADGAVRAPDSRQGVRGLPGVRRPLLGLSTLGCSVAPVRVYNW